MAETRGRLLEQAVALHRQQRLAEAERLYREILARWPGVAEAEHYLGNLLVESGRVAEGMRHIDASITLRPDEPLFHFNRATILLRHGGRAEAAIGAFREVLERVPDDLASHVNLAAACRQAGRPGEAIASLEFVLAREPGLVEARHNLANCLADLGRIDEALVEYARALEARPDALDIRMSLGNNLCRLGDYETAVGHFRQALERSPDDARIHMQLANALKAVGDLAGAERHLRRVLAIDPAHAEAHQALANVVRHRPGDPDIVAMETLIARPDLDEEARLRLNFALGKAYADIGEHARSFACYEAGNRLHRSALDYDPSETEAFFDRIEQVFAHDLPPLPGGSVGDGPRPVFIVGMPRSGTSLIEQILASHPDVFGAGESPVLGHCVDRALAGAGGFPEGLRSLPPEALAGIGAAYRERLGAQARRAGHADPRAITDKMPQNFRLTGLIAHCLPDAVILHTRRHPLDVCLSCYEQNFAGDHPYAYDLLELARYYIAYERLMAFWHRRLPGRIHDVDYGRLVADGEAGIRRLVETAGLPWDDRCLDFHSVRRAVATASDSQVRRPIYRTSVERWRRHEAALAPVKALLIEAGLLDEDGSVRRPERIDGRP